MFYNITLQCGCLVYVSVKHYSISPRPREGWIVRLEEDRRLVRQTCYRDWHRVERAAAIFRLQVADLMARGWEPGRSAT